jgi:hypothetical protein
MNAIRRSVCLLVILGACASVGDSASVTRHPPADASSIAAWLSGAAEAMGGESRLRALAAVETSGVSVWYHREQSERPEGPWLKSFTDFTDVRSFAADAVRRTSRARGFSTNDWIDSTEWTPVSTTLVISGVAFAPASGAFTLTSAPPDLEVLPVALAPERVVLSALDAPELHAGSDEVVDGYAHHVVTFSLGGARVRLILNVPSLLPKAIELTRTHPYNMFLAPWGDVTERVTFGMWTLERDGLRYPRIWDFSTNGQPDGSINLTRVRTNPSVERGQFEVPDDIRQQLLAGRRRIPDLAFGSTARPARELAPGIVKVPGTFDLVEVRQDDGVVMIEGPISSDYSVKAVADAQRRFGGVPIKAAITTSDAWPHIGGMREYVARGVPVYALDLNVPILARLFAARYESSPDALAKSRRKAVMKAVSGKTTVGSGARRLEIYPLRTATGERQMMIYWPEYRLLYTSDLFTITRDFVFLPEQVSEAVQAVSREHLDVATAFGMHYDPLPWATVLRSAAPPGRASR